ncbi:MAG: proline dehydrogenase family protein [Flavobacteriales bacterium]|nr:proline dehydrogenase family protein [Flavobacteriales bacterium]
MGNTAIAFADRSNADLWRATWLFRIIGNPTVSGIGQAFTKAALALRLPIRGAIKATIFKQFCGGENINESLATAARLAQSGIGTILDYSVEGQEDDDSLDKAMEEILRTIAMAGQRPDIPFSVFKVSGISPTQLLELASEDRISAAEDVREWELVQGRVLRISQAAYDAGVPVMIDAEESWLQPAIDALATRMMERFNRERPVVFNTIQLYRHDRLAFLKASLEAAERGNYHLGLKLVRGAYMEKERELAAKDGRPSPIHANKQAVDRDYDAAIRFCMEHLDRIAFMAGTHNEQSTLLLAQLLDARGMARNDRRAWSAQLLGMSDNISYNMAHAGYNVAKYVPYGPVREVLPYLIRRAAENTSVKGQTGRELGLLLAERKRRKQTP